MGSGTQLAHATADMILLSERLEQVVRGVDMARRTLVIMRENFAWAIGYNLIALPLAAGGWLTPWMSAIGMSFSSLLSGGQCAPAPAILTAESEIPCESCTC